MRPIDTAWWLRAAAVTFAALALAATAVSVSREESGSAASAVSRVTGNSLAAELERCNAITPASARDKACERAWAENRRRFLGVKSRSAVGPVAAVPTPAASGDHP